MEYLLLQNPLPHWMPTPRVAQGAAGAHPVADTTIRYEQHHAGRIADVHVEDPPLAATGQRDLARRR
ncbi:hypothetical protein JJB11_01615 [Ramlibacter ginsenosidimutans]|uniref:Uncharacterized protein n=1 Tax=Ramlibacter ginsenosidimutans TaxID=502333 RepID=A0A934WKM5_9BURK|nr:hypothetical protein [Ramlibacter ginsenosidimutans]MBK6004775.1 hypothetical protein [Ramlibacter ginsenosidimutans]